ncbi:F-box CPR30-like [Olea europaea subsp. europaea]|uniref:F-box CPR30-like n=1 Tax=Olea europaea subsp. europaea TaxID=158383 RepID=A0A8S0PXC9_OLEEU|nr:F-box CPR30-like [Olea europaea subsp. europaea]
MLPSDIISEILARLPVKTLLQFRCVSRAWCSIIDSQSFIKMHLHQSTATNSYHSLILGCLGKGLYYVDLDLLDKAHVIKPPVSYKGFDCISNSCNGLILVMSDPLVPPVLWNPFSRKFKILPDAPIEYPAPLLCLSQVFYGLGYDLRNDDYKVVRVVEFCSESSRACLCSATDIYRLKSNSWNRVTAFPYPLPRVNENCEKWDVQVVHGAFHTLVEDFLAKSFKIMAFGIENENHYEVMLPPNIVIKNANRKLDVLGGCLCLVSASNSGVTDIWVMKEYGVEESWTQLLSVGSPSILSFWKSLVCLKPLAYSKNGEKVLLNCDEKRLVWYDLITKTTRNVNISGLPDKFYPEVCVESLVCPGGQGGGDGIEKHGQEKRKGKKIKNGEDFLSEGSSSCAK